MIEIIVYFENSSRKNIPQTNMLTEAALCNSY